MDQITEHEAMGRDLPVLRSGRLALRVAGPGDAEALHAHISDWDVARMLARVPWPVPLSNLKGFLEETQARAIRGEAFELAILPDGHEPAGVVGLEYVGEEVHLGYWIGRAYWGRGLMSEAVSLALAQVFRWKPGIRVVSGVFADNPASLRVQEKLGFSVVGEHVRWCEARRADVRHIDTALSRGRFSEVTA